MTDRNDPQSPRIFTPEYYERMRQLEASSWWNEGMREIAADLLRRVPLPNSGLMLDAGCGSGQTMSWYRADHRAWRTVGVDIAWEGLPFATLSGLAVCQASVLALPFADSSVDAIISLDVLQHLPLSGGDEVAVREFARVLRPRGVLLIRTNAQSLPWTAPDERASFRKYDETTLRRLLQGAGFDVRILGRCNAVLGLAEIPREIRAGRKKDEQYHGILAEARSEFNIVRRLKREWLRFEGKAMAAGIPLPLGRTIFALCELRGWKE
jgi:SAM-dependent methyltransferase